METLPDTGSPVATHPSLVTSVTVKVTLPPPRVLPDTKLTVPVVPVVAEAVPLTKPLHVPLTVASHGDVAPLAPAFYGELCAWITLDLPTADLFGNAPRVVMECDARRLDAGTQRPAGTPAIVSTPLQSIPNPDSRRTGAAPLDPGPQPQRLTATAKR